MFHTFWKLAQPVETFWLVRGIFWPRATSFGAPWFELESAFAGANRDFGWVLLGHRKIPGTTWASRCGSGGSRCFHCRFPLLDMAAVCEDTGASFPPGGFMFQLV